MMVFSILLAIAAAVIMLQMWNNNHSRKVQPIRVETEDEQRKRLNRR